MIPLQFIISYLHYNEVLTEKISIFLRKNFYSTTNMSKKQTTLISFGFTKKIGHNGALVEVRVPEFVDDSDILQILLRHRLFCSYSNIFLDLLGPN